MDDIVVKPKQFTWDWCIKCKWVPKIKHNKRHPNYAHSKVQYTEGKDKRSPVGSPGTKCIHDQDVNIS